MTGIINSGASDTASFNDDSSPDTRLTSFQKLSVNAQVIPENSLDWFYRILQVCESIPGELKSAEVWLRFQGLSAESKARIWDGLSKVRIHIVDPRPYRKSYDQILRTILPASDPAKFLQQLLAAGHPVGIWLSNRAQIFTAERILSDSIGARVHGLSKIILNDGIVPLDAEEGDAVEDQILTLRDFGNEVKPLVRKVSIWAAKSAATFHEALDCFLGFDEEVRYFPNEIVRRRMKSRILKTHAFDRGDQGHLELLESARSNILKNLRDPYMPERPGETKPYTQLDSAFSYPVQAADIAAGIASKLLETQSLVTVVSAFEYVTYNGQRISVADAEEELRRMVP